MPLPNLNHEGELPEGIHKATIDEVVAQFGSGTVQREIVRLICYESINLPKTQTTSSDCLFLVAISQPSRNRTTLMLSLSLMTILTYQLAVSQ